MNALIAVDTSDAELTMVEQVARYAWLKDARVEAVTVVEPYQTMADNPAIIAAATDSLRRAVDHLRSAGLRTEGVVLAGEPKTRILDEAANRTADWILIGAHRRASDFLMGNVARGVARHAHCSVEIVRASPQPADQPYRILLAVDDSPGSTLAAKSVAERQWSPDAEVTVLSIVEMHLGLPQAVLSEIGATTLEKERVAAMQRAQNAIRTAREILEPTGLLVFESLSVLLDPPAQIISEEAAKWAANVIVLGSHGHRGVSRFLMGSISEDVAEHAACSVQVIRGHPDQHSE